MKTIAGVLFCALGSIAHAQSDEILFCDEQHPNYASCQRQLERQKQAKVECYNRDAEDLARVEALRARCQAAVNASRNSQSPAAGFAAAHLGLAVCAQSERAVKDRQRYEALRSQDPELAAKELEAQRIARETRRRNVQKATPSAALGRAKGSQSGATNHSCSSDFSCGIGYRCVKRPYETAGACMQEVDSAGLPTYGTPRASSLDIRTRRQCDFDIECPLGFTCDATYKACVKR